MLKLLRGFHGFWFFEIDPFILGLYRLVLGLVLLAFYVMLAPSWLMYYGPESISDQPLREFPGGYRAFTSVLFFIKTEAGSWRFYASCIVASIFLAAGWFPRTAMAWLWVANCAITFRNRFVVNGEEQIFALLVMFSIFLPLHHSFTLAQLLDRDKRKEMLASTRKVPVWSLKAIQVHLMLVYLLSWHHKPMSGIPWTQSAWLDGTAVYYAMMATNYPRWPGMEIFAWGDAIVSRLFTWSTLLLELLVPFLIWWRRCRVSCVLLCLGLHIGLGFLLESVVMFNAAMIAGFILFLPSRRTRELFEQSFSSERGFSWSLLSNYVWGGTTSRARTTNESVSEGALRMSQPETGV